MTVLDRAGGLELYDPGRMDRELPPVPRLGVAGRLYATPALHRLVPDRVAFRLCDARAELQFRRSPDYRERMRRVARLLLGPGHDQAAVDPLAREHARETVRRAEHIWRGHLTVLPVVGGDAAARALAAKGPLLIHFFHHGPYIGMPATLRSVGLPVLIPAAPFNFAPPSPGYAGVRDRRQIRLLSSAAPVFDAGGARGAIDAALAAGATLMIGSDLPGSQPVHVLGRRVGATAGPVRIAMAAGAPIVPMLWERDPAGGPGVMRLGDALHPHDFDGLDELHQALFDRHLEAVKAWPAAWEWPLERFRSLEDGPGAWA